MGICIGMQALFEGSEEDSEEEGLGVVPGRIERFSSSDKAVPHMGWNDVRPAGEHPLLAPGEAYFLHSYAWEGEAVAATTDHAGPVAAAVARDTLVGVQFHPEKSQAAGLELIGRFLQWRP